MKRMISAACLLLAMVSLNAQAKPTYSVVGGTLDFNAPIVQNKTSLTNLSPAGQIVYEDSTSSFFGLAPNGTWISFGSTTGIRSQVKVNGSTGNGSTGVRIKKFTTEEYSNGTDITYASNATTGDTFTINTNGIYAISYSASADDGDYFAISLNATDLTEPSTQLPAAEVLARCFQTGGSTVTNCSWTGALSAGQIIRAHQDGTTPGNDALNTFTITKIAN